ncbi:hypothetical protein HPB50_015086 [Hyalomma asiaticum]|uniref:Uncharacterized protein n=1 Tax=Hyalomma asiaticum TaxID=266040 RepID=A0ACB7T6B7_HYAAI|nr:hypothetical protein HPB50_015086 [Hyalomma asiaticum]
MHRGRLPSFVRPRQLDVTSAVAHQAPRARPRSPPAGQEMPVYQVRHRVDVPTNDACMPPRGAVEETASPARYRCDRCSASFPSSRSLVNHRLWHRDRDARVATRGTTTTTQRPPRLTNVPTSSQDAPPDRRERVDANTAPAATASNDSSTPPNEAAESAPDTPPVTSPPASITITDRTATGASARPRTGATSQGHPGGPASCGGLNSARRRRVSGSSTSSWSSSDPGSGPGPSRRPRPQLPIQEAESVINRGRVSGAIATLAATAGRARLFTADVQPRPGDRIADGSSACATGVESFPGRRQAPGGLSRAATASLHGGGVLTRLRFRLLERHHRTRIEERPYTCSRCGADLSNRPSGHPCFEGGLPDHQTSQGRHQCPRCPLSYSTAGALRNHTRRHQVEDARAGRNTAEPPAGPTSKVRRLGTPPGVGTSPGVKNADAPPPSPPESVAPPTSPHAPSSPTGSDGPPTGRRSGDVDDDATGLLEAQARVLRTLLREPPSQDSWDRCEAAWTEALALVTTAVRLPQLSEPRLDATNLRRRRTGQPDPIHATIDSGPAGAGDAIISSLHKRSATSCTSSRASHPSPRHGIAFTSLVHSKEINKKYRGWV